MIARPAPFELSELAPALGGDLESGRASTALEGVSTDTRDALEGRLFVALEGLRFDAHAFLPQAVEKGARALLVSVSGYARAGGRSAVGDEVHVVVVPDTLRGLGDLARFHRRRLGLPVIAITGSNGKTTTKEMLAALASVERCVLATEGNLNNLVGLPLTLLGLHPRHELCVAEMGMNALGEIARMTEIAEPDVGLVTNVGPAHIGELGSLDNIARAKGELFAGLPEGAIAVVNIDDPRVRGEADKHPRLRKLTFGRSEAAEVRLVRVDPTEDGQRLELSHEGFRWDIELPFRGEHNALNATAAFAAGRALVPPPRPETAAQQLAQLGDINGRFSVREVGDVTVIDDSYNANPASFEAAADTARAWAGARRLIVAAGEMHELGFHAEAGHRQVGRALARAQVAVVAGFGAGAAPLVHASGADERRHEVEDFDALADWLVERLEPGDVVLLKGSRGSRMERLIAAIEGRG